MTQITPYFFLLVALSVTAILVFLLVRSLGALRQAFEHDKRIHSIVKRVIHHDPKDDFSDVTEEEAQEVEKCFDDATRSLLRSLSKVKADIAAAEESVKGQLPIKDIDKLD